ncbi:Bmpr2 [Acrasis kona]|uniref:Bmpr2 n=1 Tax=Acrasis kona TaxID=1008807 RepID=A0AAW2YLD8_9EUKA
MPATRRTRSNNIQRHETVTNGLTMIHCRHYPRCDYYQHSSAQARNTLFKHEGKCVKQNDSKSFKHVILYRWRTEENIPAGLAFAQLIYIQLENVEKGSTWRDVEHLKPGDDLKQVVEHVIDNAQKIIFVLFHGCLSRCADDLRYPMH